jgi:hypothetical protein
MLLVVEDFFEQKSRQIRPLPSPISSSEQTKGSKTIFQFYKTIFQFYSSYVDNAEEYKG